MERIYIITGANGHLGRNIVKMLGEQGRRVRALVLPGEELFETLQSGVEVIRGDVRDRQSLAPLFAGTEGMEAVVIHAAAIVDITSDVSPLTREVNVGGTRNMVELSLAHRVHRYIHVSSVHAIPEEKHGRIIRETKRFSARAVQGGYAKTKAEASAYVMDMVREKGLPAVILHPSGIIGPLDSGANNLVAAIRSYLEGSLHMCPKGGYDLVDVRDVAAGCLAAVEQGRVGETYILSGRHYEMRQVFEMLGAILHRRGCRGVPMWLARLGAPLLEKRALRRGEKPLFTSYSLATLTSNGNFSHEKASRELGYWPRDIYQSLQDTVRWLARGKRLRLALA